MGSASTKRLWFGFIYPVDIYGYEKSDQMLIARQT